ncbi:MAG: NAD-binding protein [Pseudomonadota bacterium]
MAGKIDESRTSRVTFIVLRYMRRPLMTLVIVYAISMAGWVLIPGVDPEGNPVKLSFFHAFYFLTYTATTTGFGELPYAFSEAQRMWGIVSLYASVIAWLYALGAIITLLQNQNFRQAVAERRFAKKVERMSEPFFIICGFGNTGSLLARGLSESDIAAVVVDHDEERIKALMLRDYRVDMPSICADLREPDVLIEAGLMKEHCLGVVALTSDEELNLKISATARLLHPDVRIVTRSTSPVYEETLATLGGDIHIIDPFQTYARYLGAVVRDPAIHTLNQWLAGTPGATLEREVGAPRGKWIICGFGRMGQWIRSALEAEGIQTVVIEPHGDEACEEVPNLIEGRATHETLTAAGIKEAAGIVVGTNSDSENLAIVVNAKALNPDIYLIVRQNRHRNQSVFRAAQADFIMQPSLVAARRSLFLLIAPMLKTFFEALRDDWAPGDLLGRAVGELETVVGGTQPRLWTLEVTPGAADGVLRTVASGEAVALGDVLRDPNDRSRRLACVPLVIETKGESSVLPDLATRIEPGSRILFCGTTRAFHMVEATLHNEYTLRYLMTGYDEPRGWVMKWFAERVLKQTKAAESEPPLSGLGQPGGR